MNKNDSELLDIVIEECAKRIKACTGKADKVDLVIRWKIEHAFFKELQKLSKELL